MKHLNTKGFTLVELLAVVVILAVLATITMTVVSPMIKSSKKSLSKTQIAEIEKAAKEYYLVEGSSLEVDTQCQDDICVETACVDLSTLISSGYIESSTIKDAYTEEEMNGSVTIKYESNQYSYTYNSNRCE